MGRDGCALNPIPASLLQITVHTMRHSQALHASM